MKNTAQLIKWQTAFSVGDAELDSHHRRLIGLINDLYTCLTQRSPPTAMEEVLVHLEEYAQAHFRYEENGMRQSGFPEIESHRKIHDACRERTKNSMAGFRSSENAVSLEMLEFLKDWWKHHILTMDRQYAPYLKSGDHNNLTTLKHPQCQTIP